MFGCKKGLDLQEGIVETMKGLCPAGVGMRKESRQRNAWTVSLATRTTGCSGNKEWIARRRSTARMALEELGEDEKRREKREKVRETERERAALLRHSR